MTSLRTFVLLSAALTLGLISSRLLIAQQNVPPAAKTDPAATSPKGKVDAITVHGKSLEGNLEGDSPDRAVFVYLPPSYANSPTLRYPVVYMLHGYGLTAERWMPFANIAAAADKNIARDARDDRRESRRLHAL